MKVKRLAALTTTLVILGAGIVYAGSPWGDYQGFEKVRVQFNNADTANGDVPAILMNGRVMLPLRSLADSMHALVTWNDEMKTASIYKPNVHMIVAQSEGKLGTLNVPFGKVEKGRTMDFVVAAQADSLLTPIHSFRLDLLSPDGTVLRSEVVTMSSNLDSFWYSWPVKGVVFEDAGSYKVNFSIKLNESEGYVIVAEKVITSA